MTQESEYCNRQIEALNMCTNEETYEHDSQHTVVTPMVSLSNELLQHILSKMEAPPDINTDAEEDCEDSVHETATEGNVYVNKDEYYEEKLCLAKEILDSLSLSSDKEKIMNVICNYLCSLSTSKHFKDAAPDAPILLVTGGPGVGKSYVVQAISMISKKIVSGIIQTAAYMGIAAVNIKGSTINSLFRVRFNDTADSGDTDEKHPETVDALDVETLQKFKDEIDIKNIALLVIDEISTVTPNLIAIINARLQQAIESDDPSEAKRSKEPFGGIGVMFVGDFMQLPPTGGHSLISTAVTMAEKDCKHENVRKGLKKNLITKEKNTALYGKLKIGTALRTGTELFCKAQLFELTTQNRCPNDQQHVDFIEKMRRGESIELSDLQRYKRLTREDMKNRDWKFAPILVSTNRERLDFTLLQAQEFG